MKGVRTESPCRFGSVPTNDAQESEKVEGRQGVPMTPRTEVMSQPAKPEEQAVRPTTRRRRAPHGKSSQEREKDGSRRRQKTR